jgi:glycosyltransferase involved in cell wall biosynthesis
MKVSVPILTYNHAGYIAQAIESVLQQQVDFKYEIVIGEDCSTDGTRDIVLDFQKRYPTKIRLLLPGKNIGAMRNALQTLQACRGEYVAGVEGDDYWTSPHKLQMQADYLDTHLNCSLCHHNILKVYQDGSQEPHHRNPPDQKEISTFDDLLEQNFVASCSAMVRRDLISNVPEWVLSLPLLDWLLFLLAARGGYVRYFKEVMGVQRIHQGGVWSRLSVIQQRENTLKFYKKIDAGFAFAYHDRIRVVAAEEYFRLGQEYEMEGDFANARKCVLKCFFADPKCQGVTWPDLYKTIERLHKAILKRKAPTVYRVLAAMRRGRLIDYGASK